MTEYDDSNSGALFENPDRATDKHPDFTGRLNIDGVEHKIAGWWRTPRRGGPKFLSLRRDTWQADQPAAPSREDTSRGLDDEIPF